MIKACLNPGMHCRFNKSVSHHLWYPKADYKTDLERTFRELPENRLQICACAEWLIHNTMADPPHPSVEEMVVACTVRFEDGI